MEEVSWQTIFSGKLNVVFDDGKKTEIFSSNTKLCVFVMQAIWALENRSSTGAEVMENWRIKRFSLEERILEIEEIEA